MRTKGISECQHAEILGIAEQYSCQHGTVPELVYPSLQT